MIYIKLLILGIIEVLTEFIPVSSTGHMIIASYILNIENKNDFLNLFIVSIQLGPIISIIFLYRKRISSFGKEFYKKIFIAFIPSIFFGFFFIEKINFFFKNYIIVSISILIGGLVLIKIDDFKKKIKKKSEITYINALIIGFFQCFALIPGISRSAASIIGGLLQKIDLKTSNEFSIFLSIPTILAAILKKLSDFYLKDFIINERLYSQNIIFFFKKRMIFTDFKILFLGNILSFIFSSLVMKYFINYVNKYGLKYFGYYRVILSIIILFFIYY